MNTDSYWWPLEGLCYHGALKDELLDSFPVVHCTWREWRKMHPNTRVIISPEDPNHSDSRLGHGAEEYWERPGISTVFLNSIGTGDLDRQLPENIMVMGVNLPGGVRAYPVNEIKKDGGLINDVLGEVPILLVLGPAPDSIYSGAFHRKVRDKILKFEANGFQIIDEQSGSVWNSEGFCVEGEFKGTQLEPLHQGMGRWHTWVYPHPKTEIYKSEREEALNVELGVFEGIVEGFRESLYDVKVEREIVSLARPLQSDRGLALQINGEPFLLQHFDCDTAARDYEFFQKYSCRSGRYVLESKPQIHDDIALNTARMPEGKIQWSKKLKEKKFSDLFGRFAPKEHKGNDYPGFSDIFTGLKKHGYDVVLGAYELHADFPHFDPWGTPVGLRPGEDNWFTVTIDTKDPFEIHRFRTAEAAKEFADSVPHATIQVGRYVFYSTPVNMFVLPRYRMVDRPKEKVDWSELLEDEDFQAALRAIIKE